MLSLIKDVIVGASPAGFFPEEHSNVAVASVVGSKVFDDVEDLLKSKSICKENNARGMFFVETYSYVYSFSSRCFKILFS